jgi:hypothetical protein
MSQKAFEWMRGAKRIEREFLDLTLSDGTQVCDGCGEVVLKGEMIEKEHVYIVGPKGANEWANFFLCSDCSVRVFEMAKEVRERRRRKAEQTGRPLEATPSQDTTELNDEWGILRWGLYRAKEVLSREVELEESDPSRKDYESQLGRATEKVKDALTELEKLSSWRTIEVSNQRKKEEEPKP